MPSKVKEMKKEILETKSDEIDLIDLFRKIWDKRTTIYKSVAVFFVLGLLIVLISPKEYKSEVILLVESSSPSGMNSLLQQFGGLAGFNGLGTATQEEALTPELYPGIIKSTPFLLGIMDDRLTDSKHDSTLMVSEFLDRHTRRSLSQIISGYTIGLPGKVLGLVKGKPSKIDLPSSIAQPSPLKLTSKENALAGELSGRIKAIEGETVNTLIISAEMQDPRLAAQLADSVVKSLTTYIIDYRTQKAKTDLRFVQLSHAEAEKKFYNAQRSLALFKDRNMNIISASAQINEQNLQAEYTLAFNLYNSLAQQLEQAKLKVQEQTPVFKILEPAKVPLSKSKPKTSLVMIAMIFIGGVVGVAYILGKMAIKVS